MATYDATNRPNKLASTNVKDINGIIICEGDVLVNKDTRAASLVVFSEFTNKFGLLPLCCFPDMVRFPNTREDYLGDMDGIHPVVIDWWKLMRVGHIDENPVLKNNSSLFLMA